MRGAVAVVLLPLVLAPAVEGATQDALLGAYAAYGEEDLFEEYPALLFLKLSISNRLQSTQIPQADLDRLEDLLRVLDDLQSLHRALPDATAEDVRSAMASLLVLRSQVETLTNATIEPYRDLLNLTVASMIGAHISTAERLLPTITRTADRLALMGAAVDAAESIQDGLAYSRLALLEEETRTAYEADMLEAHTHADQARTLLQRRTVALSPEFPRYYASLFATRDDLGESTGLFEAHGEGDHATEARLLQGDLSARIRSLGTIIALLLFVYLAALLLLGWLLFWRLLRWSQTRYRAGLGDELVVEA